MHGRKKEDYRNRDEEQKKASLQKAIKYQQLINISMEIRKNSTQKQHAIDFMKALEVTGQTLRINPDVYSLFNYRKEIILHYDLLEGEGSPFSISPSTSNSVVNVKGESFCMEKNPDFPGSSNSKTKAKVSDGGEDKSERKIEKDIEIEEEGNCDGGKEINKNSVEEENSTTKGSVQDSELRESIRPKFLEKELTFTAECIKANPKSYCAWHHRQWIFESLHKSTKSWKENES